MEEKYELPSLHKQIKGLKEAFQRAATRWLEGKPVKLDELRRNERLSLCEACEYYGADKRCRGNCGCGCYMEMKTWMLTESCPRGKWGQPGLVSIIIPAMQTETDLDNTVADLPKTATGEIEIIVKMDNPQRPQGRRRLINQAAKAARGEYLYILDAHCRLEPNGWDELLKHACGPNDIVFSRIHPIDAEGKRLGRNDYGHVYLNDNLVEKWWGSRDGQIRDGKSVQESMGFTGCGWLIHRDRFWRLGGYDMSLGPYGGDGPEWAIKTWLSGGRVLIHNGVSCGHAFETNLNDRLYTVNRAMLDITCKRIKQKTLDGLWPGQIHDIAWLVGKFDPPEWKRTLLMPQRAEYQTVFYA